MLKILLTSFLMMFLVSPSLAYASQSEIYSTHNLDGLVYIGSGTNDDGLSFSVYIESKDAEELKVAIYDSRLRNQISRVAYIFVVFEHPLSANFRPPATWHHTEFGGGLTWSGTLHLDEFELVAPTRTRAGYFGTLTAFTNGIWR